jgi:putative flippase GtrA
MLQKITDKRIRFVLVGGTNTTIDFGILFILSYLGLYLILANIISTSIAFVFSFIANKHYTFQEKSGNVLNQIILFIAVTLFGLWVLQSIVIALTYPLLKSMSDTDFFALMLAKIIATVVSMIWNYILYSRVVFKNRSELKEG